MNKVSTAVQLRFDVAHSMSLSEEARQRLLRLTGKRITTDGILVIEARQYRTQEENRRAAIERLVKLVRQAVEKPRLRKKTHPSLASQQRRLEKKRRHSEIKRMRRLNRENE